MGECFTAKPGPLFVLSLETVGEFGVPKILYKGIMAFANRILFAL